MEKILHIIATPRGGDSRTLKVSKVFIDSLNEKYPACTIDELDVTTTVLPSLSISVVTGKYVLLSGKELTKELKDSWLKIEEHINRFLLADFYLISTPMWNFSIPYYFKHYIDVIIQPKYLFRYTSSGVEGLAKNKKMVIVTSRGGDYSQNLPTHSLDFQEPYLKAIFGFVGIKDITFINAQPMDMGSDIQNKKINEAITQAKEVVKNF